MAEIHWIKLNIDMFDNRKIKYLRNLPDGDSIVLIWVMLLTLAGRCNANGMIFLTENIPYTAKILADELDFPETTVSLAVSALENLGMIQTDASGYIEITGWSEHQNADKLAELKEYNKIQKRKSRERMKLLADVNDKSMTGQGQVNENVKTDIDIDKNKKEDTDKNKSVRENTHTLFNRLVSDFMFSSELTDKVSDWIQYKVERKEPYKEQGLKSLLKQIENNSIVYGDDAVINLIDECMASNWKGIIFDRLEKSSSRNQQKGRLDWIDDI